MTPTRANWFIEDTGALGTEDGPDPFAMPIEEVGKRIDLRDPKGALELRLGELIHRERNLFDRELSCPIKERSDSTCHACPVSKAHDSEQSLSVLCRIGREQEVVLTELAVLACQTIGQ